MWEIWVRSLGLGRSPGERNGKPLQYSCLESHKESDRTEQLYIHTYIHTYTNTHTIFERIMQISCSLVYKKASTGNVQRTMYYPKNTGRQIMTCVVFSSVQSLSRVQLFATPWTAAHQASLSITNSRSPPKPMSIESVIPSNHLISVVPFSSCPQSCPASGSFPTSQLFTSGSVQFSHSVLSDSLRPHESQHARPPCPSPTPRVHSNSCPLSRWCHPAISSSVVPFSSCFQFLPASESFPMSQLFAWGGQSTGVSASTSVLPMNTQDWSPLEWTGWISLQSKGLSRVFSNTIVQKHQFFGTQPSSQSNSYIHTWPQEKP